MEQEQEVAQIMEGVESILALLPPRPPVRKDGLSVLGSCLEGDVRALRLGSIVEAAFDQAQASD